MRKKATIAVVGVIIFIIFIVNILFIFNSSLTPNPSNNKLNPRPSIAPSLSSTSSSPSNLEYLRPFSAANSPASSYGPYVIMLGNVSTSYLNSVYIPVYMTGGTNFTSLVQTFSFDSSLLMLNGTLNDVASQNVTFSIQSLAPGMAQVVGIGNFTVPFAKTTLYYLVFNPLTQEQTITTVLLDETTMGGVTSNFEAESAVTLARGWTNLGPANIDVTNNGGQAGTVPAVGYSPQNLNILYVASGRGGPWGSFASAVHGFGGMYKSTDGGQTWRSIDLGLNSTLVTSIAVNPTDPNMVVVSTGGISSIVGGGIYKTSNGGNSWQETYGLGGDFLTVQNGALYAASYHAILCSNDFGSSWQVLSSFPSTITTVAVAANGTTIFAGVYQNGQPEILKSTDKGASYSTIGVFPDYYTVSQIVINPTNESKLFSLVSMGYINLPNLFNSNDGGQTWNTLNDSQAGISYGLITEHTDQKGNYLSEVPQCITYDPLNGNIFYVVGPSYLYKSANAGQSFTLLNDGGGDNRMINVDPLNDSIVFVGSDQGLVVSHDGGKQWTQLNNRSSSMIYTVATSGNNIFTVAQDFSPIFSSDGGKSWHSSGNGEIGWASVDPYNSSIVVVETTVATAVSNDGGNTFFTPSVSNLTGFVSTIVGGDSHNVNGIVYGNKKMYAEENGGIYVSSDWGRNWQLLPGSPLYCQALAIDPINQNVLYASNWYQTFRSTDGGQSWKTLSILYLHSISVNPLNDSIVAAMFYPTSSTFGVPLISYNMGADFSKVEFQTEDIFTASPQVFFQNVSGTAVLVYTTDEGLFASRDLGQTWQDLTYNIPAPVISDFFVSNNGTAYVSTYGMGVWSNPDLFNNTFNKKAPLLTAYVPQNSTLFINGEVASNQTGYFEVQLNVGSNSLKTVKNGTPESDNLNTTASDVFYIDFSLNTTAVNIITEGLSEKETFSLIMGNSEFNLHGGSSYIVVQQGQSAFVVANASTDYSILSPTYQAGQTTFTFLSTTLDIKFNPTTAVDYTNLTGKVNGPSWTHTVAHNGNYEVFAGTSNLGIFNMNNGQFTRGPSLSSEVNLASPYQTGFLLGGHGQNGATLYFYNLTSGSLSDWTGKLPGSLQSSDGSITGMDITSEGAAVITGSATQAFFIGVLDENGTLQDLTSSVPSGFLANFPFAEIYLTTYIGKFNCEVLAVWTGIPRLGILFLNNRTFQDYSASVPEIVRSLGVNLDEWPVAYRWFTSDGYEAFINGMDTGTGSGFEALFSPVDGLTDISSLFPSEELFYAASWNGREFLLSGENTSSNTLGLYAYDPPSNQVTRLDSGQLQGFQTVDAIDSTSTTQATVSGLKVTQAGQYAIYNSQYATFSLTPTGTIAANVTPPNAVASLNGTSVPLIKGTFAVPEFAGTYNLTVAESGFTNQAVMVTVQPFQTTSLQIQLSPQPIPSPSALPTPSPSPLPTASLSPSPSIVTQPTPTATHLPTPTPNPTTSPPFSPTSTPTHGPATPTPTQTASPSSTLQPSPSIPEIPAWIATSIIIAAAAILLIARGLSPQRNQHCQKNVITQ